MSAYGKPRRKRCFGVAVDLNSYFASIEAELRPELRGHPIGMVPVADIATTCVIAAKKYGVRTGCAVHDAKVLFPHMQLIEARPRHYVEYHHRIVAAIVFDKQLVPGEARWFSA